MSKSKPLINREKVKNDIEALSRDPFRDRLNSFLMNHPNNAALKMFANKKPDKWASAVSVLSKLSGYQDNSQPSGDTNIYMQINQLPDSSLKHELEETLKALKGMDNEKEVIEHETIKEKS